MQCIECNALCHSTSCLNEHRTQKMEISLYVKKYFLVPIAKLNCTITKQMESIWISIHVEKVFVKTAKFSQMFYEVYTSFKK